jgi:hypothetical protein
LCHPERRINYHALTGVVFIQTPSAMSVIPPRAHARGSLLPSAGHRGVLPFHTFREAECMDIKSAIAASLLTLLTLGSILLFGYRRPRLNMTMRAHTTASSTFTCHGGLI